ncbi:MAG: multicopper oxidase family protein [Deltaproteobacteria bacterium]|nr:multicopper oxidase family protein [Deltaproteobacteria bacterium]
MAGAAAIGLALRSGSRLPTPAPGAPSPSPSSEPAAHDPLADEARAAIPDDVPRTGVVHEVTLEAKPVEIPLLEGRPLAVWAYNGQVPGPTLRVRVGDTLRVTLENRLPQPTTIHWHGVRVPNAMDGTPGVTQSAVEPGGRFVYEFVARDAGTFWYHPHVRASEQVERGLYGVLVVEEATPPRYSREIVWVLDDWRLTPSGRVDPAFNTGHDLAHDGRWGQVVTINGIVTPTLSLSPGERVRLRILDSANGRVFAPDFGELFARVIAVDGRDVAAPFDARGFELAPGNRLDVELEAPAGAHGRRFEIVDRYTGQPVALASVVVDARAVASAPASSLPPHVVPAWRDALSRPATSELRLNAERGGPLGIAWTINGRAGSHDHHDGGSGDLAFTLARDRFARLRFVNDSFRIHPMHLHGVFFKVLARNDRPVDEGFMRDTVLVHAKETIDIGVVPRDDGRWMMHCHILEHAEAGMMTLFEVR